MIIGLNQLGVKKMSREYLRQENGLYKIKTTAETSPGGEQVITTSAAVRISEIVAIAAKEVADLERGVDALQKKLEEAKQKHAELIALQG